MTTMADNKENRIPKFSIEREQSQTCLNSAEREKIKGSKNLNVPHLRFPEFSGEWEKCSIQDYGEVVTGNTPPTSHTEYYENGSYLWASPADLGINKNITETKTKLSLSGFKKTRSIPKGSVLVTCIGSTIGKMGMAAETMSSNQQINSIVVNDKSNSDFVYYAICRAFPRYLSEVAVQAVPILSKSNFEKLPNYTTCRDEQDKIGYFLNLLDERIATQNKVIEDLKLLRDAISKQLFYTRNNWSTFKVSDIAEIGRGRVISAKEIAMQSNPLYPVYSSQTSNNGVMGFLDDYAFDGEYITWTTDGANAGTVFYRNGKFNCTNVCGILKLRSEYDTYFCSLVLGLATRKYVSINLANPKLMNNTMASITIGIPSLTEQKRISNLFRGLDNELSRNETLVRLYNLVKTFLLQQLFI